MEDLVSRGHHYADVVNGYPLALVLNFQEAARLNRRQAALELGLGVSLGIRDAFAKEGTLVSSWLKQAEEEPEAAPPSSPAAPLNTFLQGLPVTVRKKRG